MRAWLRTRLPDPARLAAVPGLARLAPLLRRAELWRIERRAVARGLALGVFFGVLIPFAQIPAAVLAAWALRSNVPAAALGTLVSNPLTVAPLYGLAYGAGAWLLGADTTPDRFALEALGKPLAAGLALLAPLGATLAYLGVHAAWRLAAWRRAAHLQRIRNLQGERS